MMAVFLQCIALASVGLVAPASILLVILMLMSEHGWRNGVTFVLGYIVMYGAMGAGILVLGREWVDRITDDQLSVVSFVLIGLGVICVGLAGYNWFKRPDPNGQTAKSPFEQLVDGITPLRAFIVGAVVTFLNLKNLAIFLSAVSVLLLSDLLLVVQLTMLMVMVVFFCSTTMIPVGICLMYPDRSGEYLGRMKGWIGRHSRPIGVAVTLFIGGYFLYLGIFALG